jgi:hypothetical protein
MILFLLLLTLIVEFETSDRLSTFRRELNRYTDCTKFTHYEMMLKSSLKSEYEKLKNLNQEQFYILFKKAKEIGREKFVDYLKYVLLEG